MEENKEIQEVEVSTETVQEEAVVEIAAEAPVQEAKKPQRKSRGMKLSSAYCIEKQKVPSINNR